MRRLRERREGGGGGGEGGGAGFVRVLIQDFNRNFPSTPNAVFCILKEQQSNPPGDVTRNSRNPNEPLPPAELQSIYQPS